MQPKSSNGCSFCHHRVVDGKCNHCFRTPKWIKASELKPGLVVLDECQAGGIIYFQVDKRSERRKNRGT